MDVKKSNSTTATQPPTAASGSTSSSATTTGPREEALRAMKAVSPVRLANFLSTNPVTKDVFGAIVNVVREYHGLEKPPAKDK